jgi:hypothetical protein
MRHFRSREFAPAFAVPRLPYRVQPPSTELRLVTRPRSSNRVAPLLAGAVHAEPPAAITAPAESKLDAAPPAGEKPKKFRRQEAPCRRFLDMELRLWSNVRTPSGVFLPELQKAQSSSSRAFANFGGRALYADPTDLAQISVGASVSASNPASHERVKTGQSLDARTCFLSTSSPRRWARRPVRRPSYASCAART